MGQVDAASGIIHIQRLSEEEFDILQESINNGISLLHTLRISSVKHARHAIRTNAALRERINQRQHVINKSANPEIRQIAERLETVARMSLAVNSGGWLAVLVAGWLAIWVPTKFVQSVTSLPSAKLKEIFPRDSCSSAALT